MLTEIFDEVKARLAAMGVVATVEFGGHHLRENASPPRIVWVPMGGPGSSARQPGEYPRRLRTRNPAVDVHLWAEDFTAAEELLNDFLEAVHHITHGSYAFNNESWSEGNSELSTLGATVTVSVSFSIPVVERFGVDQATIKTVGHTVDD